MLERVWRKGKPLILLVGMQTDTTTMEISLKNRNKTTIISVQFCSSIQFMLCDAMQHTRFSCPSATPGTHYDK